MNYIYFLFFTLINLTYINAQSVAKVEPPNWWTDMHHHSIQLMVYGDDISACTPEIDHPHVQLDSVILADSPNYLFINITLNKNISAGDVKIVFNKKGKQVAQYDYPILDNAPTPIDGFTSADAIYLITPDRFANSNPDNDNIPGMKEIANRKDKGGRHGGDIEGIMNHLDYIHDMGFTAIWLNPLLENNMQKYSYHGYSTTDFYKVDPRFGSNKEYRQLADSARQKDLKLIMDMIVNHCGLYHWWADDLPYKDWYNQWEEYTETNHQKSVLQDPYVSDLDKKQFTDGWFVPTMPDLNQHNPQMARYLIQNSIWWVEYLGLSGIRMDTYSYPDEDFMSEWTTAMMKEYPTLNIVGEEWHEQPTTVSYWQKGKHNPNGYTSDLKSVMDFPINMTLIKALTEEESWSGGWRKLYEMMAMDYLYPDPMNLVTFPDNHDMARIYPLLLHDLDLWKMAMVHVLTNRGIPQIYYGTEILMDSPAHRDDGAVRADFPGGWPGDDINAVTNEGLSPDQIMAQKYLQHLLNWRKDNPALHHGKLMHFKPANGVYVYFRYLDDHVVMVALNKSESVSKINTNKYQEIIKNQSTAKDIISGKKISIQPSINIPARGLRILEWK